MTEYYKKSAGKGTKIKKKYLKRVLHLDGVIQDVRAEPGGDAGGGAQGGRRVDLQQPGLHRGNSVGLAITR